MLNEVLKERGNNYGNFHTFSNLAQTINKIIIQHFYSTHQTTDKEPVVLPHFMEEALHMICHKLARISNGNPYYEDSWRDIAGYATLVADILLKAQAEAQVAKLTEKTVEEPQND